MGRRQGQKDQLGIESRQEMFVAGARKVEMEAEGSGCIWGIF